MAAAEGAAASGAAAATVIYLARGAVCAGRMLSRGERNCRIADGSRARRIARDRVLAELPAAEAERAAARANELAAGLRVEDLWEKAAGRQLTAAALAEAACPGEGLPGMLAVRAAQSGDPAYFRQQGEELIPVSAAAAAAIAKGRAARERARKLELRQFEGMERGEPSPEVAKQALAYLRGDHDANSIGFRMLRKFCSERTESVGRLALRWGLIKDELQLHLQTALASLPPAAPENPIPPCQSFAALPLLAAEAFSIDGTGTLEIDDAFSVDPLGGDRWRIGIHISAPAAGLAQPALQQAEQRKTTIYLPDRKLMLLPAHTVAAYALAAGEERPAVSLLLDFDAASGEASAGEIAYGRIRIAANLPLEDFAGWQPGQDGPHSEQLAVLSALRASMPAADRPEGERRAFLVRVPEPDVPRIMPRAAVAAIDALIASLMIAYNRAAARTLRAAGVARILRSAGRNVVRSGPAGGPDDYAWATSPLRRFIDLCNQQQLLAVLAGSDAPHRSEQLREHARDYDTRHAAARNAQQTLEKYWAMRWLDLRRGQPLPATLGADARTAALHEAPVAVRVQGSSHEPGTVVSVVAQDIDLCALKATGAVQ